MPQADSITSKVCSQCGIEKATSEFYWDRRDNRFDSRCKACRRKFYERERERLIRRQRRYYVKARYGISEEEYFALLEGQGGVCKVCSADDPSGNVVRYFDIDHDHATGEIRGLLCNRCNNILFRMGDDARGVERFARYLRSYPLCLDGAFI